MTPPDPSAPQAQSAPPAASLRAHIEERILAPMRRSPRARQWFAVTVVTIVAMHGALLAYLFHRDEAPALVAKTETPIEIVVEKPPEPPKPPQKQPEPPKPPPKPELEKEAHSAPRAPSEQKVETDQLQKETHAPKAETPLRDGKPEPVKEAAAPAPDPTPANEAAAAAAKEDVLKKDAEALDKATPKPPEKPKALAKAGPRAKQRQPKTAIQRLAGTVPLPDYSFARPTKKAPVTGGNEDARYLAIVYGMIMRHRGSVAVPAGIESSVTIAFEVDDGGRVLATQVQQTSGIPQIDAAAALSIRRAAPFPPPPPGAPHGLIATIVYGDRSEPVYSMDDR